MGALQRGSPFGCFGPRESLAYDRRAAGGGAETPLSVVIISYLSVSSRAAATVSLRPFKITSSARASASAWPTVVLPRHISWSGL